MDDILSEVRDLVSGHVYGDYISALCVFHKDSTPSLLINPTYYNCLACGAYGKTKDLLNYLKKNPVEKVKISSPRFWSKLKDMDLEEISWKAYNNLKENSSNQFYLEQRGILEMRAPLRIGFIDGFYTFPVFDPKRKVIGMVARAGKVIQKAYNIRYLTPNKSIQPTLLYCANWERVQSSKKVFLVFGIIDAISAEICGIPAITGSLGHNIPSELFKSLRKPIFILGDGDGRDLPQAINLQRKLGWRAKIIKLDYPENCKDLNDILKEHGKTKLQTILDNIYTGE